MSVLRSPHIGPHSGIRTPNKAFTGGAGAATYPTAVLVDTPLLYWRLDEPSGASAADSSGNAHPGTYGAGVTLAAAGATTDGHTAAAFNNTATAVVTSAFNPFVAGSSRTFELWANRTDQTGNDDFWSGDGANPPVLELNAGASGDTVFYPDGAASVTWTAALPAVATYKHVAMTWVDTTKTAELFVDGVSKGTRVAAAAFGAAPGNFQAGRASASFWNGSLDEVAVYGTALSAARILAHFNAR